MNTNTPPTFCYRCTIRVAHDDCDAVRQLAQAAATTPAQAWRQAMVELNHATHAYHRAINATETASEVCNFAWFDAARTAEREAAERYTCAVRAEHVTRAAVLAATQAVLR